MKNVFGVASIIVGAIIGFYGGIWWAFVGGIKQVISGFQSSPLNSSDIAIGLCRIFFATSIGEFIAAVLIIFGIGIFGFTLRK